MSPEWCGEVSGHLEEERRVYALDCADKMLADKKAALDKVWTSADPAHGVRSVFRVEGNGTFNMETPLPFGLEGPAPVWQVVLPAGVMQANIELLVVFWRCKDGYPYNR